MLHIDEVIVTPATVDAQKTFTITVRIHETNEGAKRYPYKYPYRYHQR